MADPIFRTPINNPFGLTNIGERANPAFADIDGDNDPDAFVGNSDGDTLFFQNIGTPGITVFDAASINPSGLTNNVYLANPAFADIDNDGDLDAFVGDGFGNMLFYWNTGAADFPSFVGPDDTLSWFTDVGWAASPALADIDGDGDLDAFVGNGDGNTLFYRNFGNADSPSLLYESTNPFGLTDVGSVASPALVDIDDDGDLDAFVGNSDGNTLFFQNTGSVGSPFFDAASTNPFGLSNVGNYASPALADIDGDGDLDAFVGNSEGNTLFYQNDITPPPNTAPTATNLDQAINFIEDTSAVIADIVITDPDEYDQYTASVILASGNSAIGSLSAISGNGETYVSETGVWSVSGTQTAVNAALAALTFIPVINSFAATSAAVSLSDGIAPAITGTLNFNGTAVNDAPNGANKTVSLIEDVSYTLTTADFNFSDPNDSPANTILAVKIATLPATGTLNLNNVAVTAGQSVTAADIVAGKLVFTPAVNANLTFQVQDNGGIANGGADLDQTPNTITFNVSVINDAPAGASKTISLSEDTSYTMAAADFAFSDPIDSPANTLLAVKIASLPAAGTFKLNNIAVTAGQFISATDISAGKLVFSPAANATGTGYANFTFQVQDNGGTAYGGADLDPTPNTITFNVTAVNDAPAGVNKTISIREDNNYTLAAADFGLSDPNDSPANTLLAVKIAALPAVGTLKLNNVAVTAGQSISATDIVDGKLVFAPAAHANGTGYANFSFQVQDNGGIANGGVDLDRIPNTISFNVTALNDGPSGVDKTISLYEDRSYTLAIADFGFTDPNDSPANTLLAVKIASLPATGTLKLNNIAVITGQSVVVADIAAGRLVFTPAANTTGTGNANFSFQVQDNGGIAYGGVDLDQTANTITFNVTAVNDAPAGASKTISLSEDTSYTMAAADFGFSDPNDSPANTLLAVKIASLPATGTLKLNNIAVTAGQFISATDISAGRLVFSPAANATGTGYANFSFQVQDNGGIAYGGADLDPTPNTITFNVTAVNDAPAGAHKTISIREDNNYTLAAADFSLSDLIDSPANTLLAVKIASLPAAGTLKLNNIEVTAGQFISATDISAGKLVFSPAANATGTGYANFSFQVQDNGGTANGGVDLDPIPNTITFNVMALNDGPSGVDKTISLYEDRSYTLAIADFGFSDPNDSPANTLLAVKIATLPAAGTLKLNNIAVITGQSVVVADIAAGRLVFTPAANTTGTGYANFSFQVQDNGGTANSGVDLDQTANTITFNVTAVNDAPVGAHKTISIREDNNYTLAAADFGLSDPNDSPANTLLAVKIASLPATGTLKLNNMAVTAGQFISAIDISAGKLVFSPAANATGTGYANFSFQVQDNGGTVNGGADLDPTPNTITFNVTVVNDAPSGAHKTISLREDNNYTLAAADFGFSDLIDSPANTLLAVKIASLPAAGTLKLNNVAVTAGQSITATDISAGRLVFTPAANGNGTGYADFTFQVQDNGGTGNGGVDLDQIANTITFNVLAVRDDLNLVGTAGNDILIGDLVDPGSYDTLSGLGGNDILDGRAGADTMLGGNGSDIYFVDNVNDVVSETNSVLATGGNDTVYSTISYTLGTSYIEKLHLGDGAINGTGNTLNNTIYAGTGNNLINGMTGTDTATYSEAAAGVTISLAVLTAQNTGGSGTDTLTNIENLTGSNFNDILTGNANANTLDGGSGDDILSGGRANDILIGGAGIDWAYYNTATAGVKVNLNVITAQNTGTSAGTDTLQGIENLLGSNFNDTLTGNAIANTLDSGSGDDILGGDSGNDILIGGMGNDSLTGGSGADRFDYNSSAETGLASTTRDTITDFKHADLDIIDLFTIDADVSSAGDQMFSFIGTALFSSNATGQLRFDSATNILYGSTDNDNSAEFSIQLTGVASLVASDFIL